MCEGQKVGWDPEVTPPEKSPSKPGRRSLLGYSTGNSYLPRAPGPQLQHQKAVVGLSHADEPLSEAAAARPMGGPLGKGFHETQTRLKFEEHSFLAFSKKKVKGEGPELSVGAGASLGSLSPN